LNKDEFLDNNYPEMLRFLNQNILNLENKIRKKGNFVTKKEKERLEYFRNHYDERIKWYEKQLIIEKKIWG